MRVATASVAPERAKTGAAAVWGAVKLVIDWLSKSCCCICAASIAEAAGVGWVDGDAGVVWKAAILEVSAARPVAEAEFVQSVSAPCADERVEITVPAGPSSPICDGLTEDGVLEVGPAVEERPVACTVGAARLADGVVVIGLS